MTSGAVPHFTFALTLVMIARQQPGNNFSYPVPQALSSDRG
jgi:hypothetical protein